MFGVTTSEDQPIAWIGKYPVRVAAFLAAAYLLGGSTLAAFAGGPGWPFRIATAAFVCAEAEEIAITLVLPRWHANVRSLTHALVLRRAAR